MGFKVKLIGIILLAASFSGLADAGWEIALLDMQHQPNHEDAGGGYYRCFYQTTGGYAFYFATKANWCLPVVNVNLESGQGH